ncbi:MAG: hypothetical protein OEN55_14785 [Alphaproteobacteria bacterium]|nr:hypothetical protein [Alphaproteobacteria bacterium]
MDLATSGLDEADLAVVAGNLSAATGGAAPHQALRLMQELTDAASPGGADGAAAAEEAGDEAGAARVVAALEAAMALAPRDPLEGMLVAQMTAVHAAAMRCLGRAAACADHPKIEALYLREAARLLHLFQRQAEMLDRRARRLGRPAERAADPSGTAAAEAADAAAGIAWDMAGDAEAQALLRRAVDAVRADLSAHRRERAGAEAQGAAQAAGRESGAGRGSDP